MTGPRLNVRYTLQLRDGSKLAAGSIEEAAGGFWAEIPIVGDWIETPDGYRPTIRGWRREWLAVGEIRRLTDHGETGSW